MSAPTQAPTAEQLRARRCEPCTGSTPKLTPAQIALSLGGLEGWTVQDGKLHKTFRFPDFVDSMRFLNRVAEVAEADQHHPDFSVHYNRVAFTIWTHAIGGLSENDLVLAAKIDALAS